MTLSYLLQHEAVQNLAQGHPDGVLGIADVLIRAAVDIMRPEDVAYLICISLGIYLLRADPIRLHRFCSKLDAL